MTTENEVPDVKTQIEELTRELVEARARTAPERAAEARVTVVVLNRLRSLVSEYSETVEKVLDEQRPEGASG